MRKGVDLLVGIREMKSHLRVGVETLKRLVEKEGLPVYKLAQGNGRLLWISSATLIHQWLAEKIRREQAG